MAVKRIPQLSKVSPKPVRDTSKLKAAAKKAAEDDDTPNITHQVPGTGKAGAVDPKASAAILNSGKSTSTTTAETKTPVSSAKTSEVESASETIRNRLVEEKLKGGASGDENTGTLTTPRMPGEQSNDSGTAGSGTGSGSAGASSGASTGSGAGSGKAGSEASGGSGGATSEGGKDQFGLGAAAAKLDAATEAALSQLDAARPDLKGGLDVFGARTGAATSSGSSTGHEGQLAAAAEASKFNDPRESDDPGAEHAADAVGQVTSGRGAVGSMFGERLDDAKSELGLMEGLLGDATSKASSPSVAKNPAVDTLDNVVGAATGFAGVVSYVTGGAAAAEAALAAAEDGGSRDEDSRYERHHRRQDSRRRRGRV
ncbi:hypothetical protein EDM76_00640, partial [bacterium]